MIALSPVTTFRTRTMTRSRPMTRFHNTPLSRTIVSLALAGCSALEHSPDADSSTGLPLDGRTVITVSAADAGRPLDPRLFGTNVPAWINPTNLANDSVRALTRALGPTVLRFPGGSWSNAYDWLACENGDGSRCYWTWAARPTDMLNFARATGNAAMWTVSMNGTAKEAAAVVAFFNGRVGDTTLIGVDLRGRDWKRVGDWAALRSQHGNPEPLPIRTWEVGNEIYGSKPGTGGTLCAPWGWEDTWTCDGAEYMSGKGVGAARHEGYLEFRLAMRAVDSTISVGAVGVPEPASWSDWGNKVFRLGGAKLDFYVIHQYAFDAQPKRITDVLARPQRMWKDAIAATNAASEKLAGGRRVPIAVTEYNLAAFQDLDNDQLMTRAVNALFVADMVGQMAESGVTMANQWNLANGKAGNGTDYGLFDTGTKVRSPQYFAMRLWTGFGTTLLPVTSAFDPENQVSTYAARGVNGSVRVMVINKTGKAVDARVVLAGATRGMAVTMDVLSAGSLEATSVAFNGVENPRVDLTDAPGKRVGTATGAVDVTLVPYSVTVVRFGG